MVGGVILGVLAASYFNRYGFYIGNFGISGMLLQDTIYAYLQVKDLITLSIATYVITLVASLYPAILAARLEPVEALHAQ